MICVVSEMPWTHTGVVSVFLLSVHGRERLPNDQRMILDGGARNADGHMAYIPSTSVRSIL